MKTANSRWQIAHGRIPRWIFASIGFGVLTLVPVYASAHGVGELYALPVPLEYYLFGAALAVASSFFVIALFVNRPQYTAAQGGELHLAWLPRALFAVKLGALFLFLFAIVAGAVGDQIPFRNFLPIFFWVYFVLGVGMLSVFIGNIWEKVDPLRTLGEWILGRSRSKRVTGFLAVLLLLGLYWLELVSTQSFVPRVLSTYLILYVLLSLLMAKLYENWHTEGELFSVLFGFIGNLATFRINDQNNAIVKVSAWHKLSGTPYSLAALGIAAVLLAGTSFDSLIETQLWYDFFGTYGLPGSLMLNNTAALILAPLPFIAAYLLAIWLMKLLTQSGYSTLALARRFVVSLAPIAFGYTLAHSFSLLMGTAPQMLALLSDPFGFGWNLLGTASFVNVNILLSAKLVWFVEIGLVILAHVIGVLYAHMLALNIFKDPRVALKSQYPMVLLMVGFTALTLWLLSQPLVIAGGSQ